jgi:hypothetical protein
VDWPGSGTCARHILDFKLSLCFECRLLSSGLFPGVCSLNANVSEHCLFHLHRRKLQTPVNNLEESIQHVIGCCECGNEHLGFIKCEKFLKNPKNLASEGRLLTVSMWPCTCLKITGTWEQLTGWRLGAAQGTAICTYWHYSNNITSNQILTCFSKFPISQNFPKNSFRKQLQWPCGLKARIFTWSGHRALLSKYSYLSGNSCWFKLFTWPCT